MGTPGQNGRSFREQLHQAHGDTNQDSQFHTIGSEKTPLKRVPVHKAPIHKALMNTYGGDAIEATQTQLNDHFGVTDTTIRASSDYAGPTIYNDFVIRGHYETPTEPTPETPPTTQHSAVRSHSRQERKQKKK